MCVKGIFKRHLEKRIGGCYNRVWRVANCYLVGGTFKVVLLHETVGEVRCPLGLPIIRLDGLIIPRLERYDKTFFHEITRLLLRGRVFSCVPSAGNIA